MDTAAVVVTAPLTLPVALLAALQVRLELGAPVLYRQTRVGLNGRPFELLKLRSMLPEEDQDGRVLTISERLTPFGVRLRKSSLDELPQLLNVLKGDMGLVGPRPFLPCDVQFYTAREKLRHLVRPGLTGASQVAGRNSVAWDSRLEIDAKYVENVSLYQDARILLKTLSRVTTGFGVSQDPSKTGFTLRQERSGSHLDGLILQPLTEEHIGLRVEWWNDPSTRDTARLGSPITVAGTRDWLAAVQADDTREDYVILDSSTGEPVAMAGFTRTGDAGVAHMYMVVAPRHRGQGFGTITKRLLIQRLKEMGFTGVESEVRKTNKAMLRINQKAGLTIVGEASDPEWLLLRTTWPTNSGAEL